MNKDVYKSGATRHSDGNAERHDLIPPVVLKRESKIWAEGALHHPSTIVEGEGNWKQGLPKASTIQHLLKHLNDWRLGDRNEDHLAKVRWGIGVLMYFEEYGNPAEEVNDLGSQLTEAFRPHHGVVDEDKQLKYGSYGDNLHDIGGERA